MTFLLYHGGLRLCVYLAEVCLAPVKQLQLNLKGRPGVLCLLPGARGSTVQARWSSLHERCATQCGPDAAASS